jgi:hypothetical protein
MFSRPLRLAVSKLTDRKAFYERLLKDFIEDQGLLVEADFEQLPDWEPHTLSTFYSYFGNWGVLNSLEDWAVEANAEELENDYKIFGEQLYLKGYATPDRLIRNLDIMLTQVREVLPHKFKVALEGLDYREGYNGLETETVFVWIVFISDEILESLEK